MKTENKHGITIAYLNECFRYEDGKVYWKERPNYHFTSVREWKRFNAQYANKEAFSSVNNTNGYAIGAFDKKKYLRSYIVYSLHHGFPDRYVMRKDKCRTNDSINNLYEYQPRE